MTRKLIIDADPGIDDAIAILLALSSPELELLALHTVAGNCPLEDATANALRVLELACRGDIPVHAGCPKPLIRDQIFGKFHGRGGLGGDALPPAKGRPREGHAVTQLIARSHAARAAGEKLTLCAIGPLTNLATALAMDPSIAGDWQEVVIMGGGFRVSGNRTPYAEFNFLADPHAVRIVLQSGARLVIMSLDLTHQVIATPARVAALRDTGAVFATAAARLMTNWDRGDPARYGAPGGPLHDPTTVAYLIAPHLFSGETIPVEVDCELPTRYGHMVADWHGQSDNPTRATVMTKVDPAGFFALLTERLTAPRS